MALHSQEIFLYGSVMIHLRWSGEIGVYSQLVGTPLAFSIWAGSADAVTGLLKLGANPAASAFGESESFIDGVLWTHLHLAAMLHHAEILILLIAALDPQEKLRLSASSIALVLCYSSKVERIAIHGRFTGIALQKTVAALEILDQNPLWRDDSVMKCETCSPLATAIEFNDHDVAQAILERYPHLATTPIHALEDRSCYTYPAHLAVRIGSRREADDSVSMLEMLFYWNKDSFHTLDSSGSSPLHVAVTEYSTAIPHWILDHHPGSPLLHAVDRDGRTALHYCISTDIAELLLHRGISVDHADEFGMTSLHCAALTGASEVMQVLIRWNADIDAIDITSSSALHYSMVSGSSDAAHMLLAHESNVKMQNIHGESPLHIVARRQRDDLVRALLHRGSSTTLRNNHGLTPLHVAISLETSDPRKLVTLCSQDTVSLCDEAGNNIIHTCSLFGRFDWLECIKRFFSNVDLCVLNESGQAPIHIAAKKLDIRTARHLLEDPETVNFTDSRGNTAIHIALAVQGVSEAERERFCSFLVLKGATLRQANDDGQTPWSIAIESQSAALMSIIFTLGGVQACCGIVYHDCMLQAAFGEKDIAKATAYYDNAGMHLITQIFRSQLIEISKKYPDSSSLLLPLSFQDYEKEVYIPEDPEISHYLKSPTTVTMSAAAEKPAVPGSAAVLSTYSNLPEAIEMQIVDDERLGVNTGKEHLEFLHRLAKDRAPTTYDTIVRGFKLAGKVTGGTVLAVIMLPAMPVLLPLWYRRRRKCSSYREYAELCSSSPVQIHELEAAGGPYELPGDPPIEKTIILLNNETTPERFVDLDLLEFLIEQNIFNLLTFAEELEYKLTIVP
jgi:ankyrin repeat protein